MTKEYSDTKFPEDIYSYPKGQYKPNRKATGERITPVPKQEQSYDAFVESLAKYKTVKPNETIVRSMYCALGLVGEAGEFSEKVKKWHRDGEIDRHSAALELGDVLYYLTASANLLGYSLSEIERLNRAKLTDRQKRGMIHGSGDNR